MFAPKFRFRQVASVEAGNAKGARQDLSYEKDQVWVSTKKSCEFGVPFACPNAMTDHGNSQLGLGGWIRP